MTQPRPLEIDIRHPVIVVKVSTGKRLSEKQLFSYTGETTNKVIEDQFEVSGGLMSTFITRSHQKAVEEAEFRKSVIEKFPFKMPQSEREKQSVKRLGLTGIDYSKAVIRDFTLDK